MAAASSAAYKWTRMNSTSKVTVEKRRWRSWALLSSPAAAATAAAATCLPIAPLNARRLPAALPRLTGTCSKCGTRPFCFHCVADYLEKVGWWAGRGSVLLCSAPGQGTG